MLTTDNLENVIASYRKMSFDFNEFKNNQAITEINGLQIDLLDAEKVYHLDQIKQLCVDYRLRFLELKLYKSSFPVEAIEKLKEIENNHNTKITDLKIVAPAKLFKLKNYDDPLLFASLGNNYYYLIHKWGSDFKPLRKWRMWPFKNFENFMFSIIGSSFMLILLLLKVLFKEQASLQESIILFLFTLKWLVFIAFFYLISKGKNFNTHVWDSKYFN